MSRVDFKIVLLGSEFVGKTSLVVRFVHSTFNDSSNYQNTIGAAYSAKRLTSRGHEFIVGIWDTAGSERYEAMSRMYYRGARAAILCYDPTNEASWRRLQQWVLELRQSEPECILYICGTKKDLFVGKPRATDKDLAERYAKGMAVFYTETSSRTGENIEELFQRIADDCSSDLRFMERLNQQRIELDQERQLQNNAKRSFCSC